jgi:hypothetical protein
MGLGWERLTVQGSDTRLAGKLVQMTELNWELCSVTNSALRRVTHCSTQSVRHSRGSEEGSILAATVGPREGSKLGTTLGTALGAELGNVLGDELGGMEG